MKIERTKDMDEQERKDCEELSTLLIDQSEWREKAF